ncbi:MAG: glycosyltransferase [Gemmatimonadales bacterium]
MNVAIFMPEILPVAGYGGTERIAVNQVRGLAARGHTITLLAGAGSRVAEAALVSVPLPGAKGRTFEIDPYLPPGTDVVLSNVKLHHPPTSAPWVEVLHGNRRPNETGPVNTIHVSGDHARRHGGHCWVHNGVDPAEVEFRPTKQAFDLFLGRLHAVKGYYWAIAGAKRLDRKLRIAGAWRPSLDRRIRYLGQVGGAQKTALVADARLLWMPALWDEPFGMTLVEAMGSGTPVLGTRRGALPEIITPEVGRLGGTLDELLALAPECEKLAPEACRARFEKYFTHHVMAAEYERVLQEFVRTGTLPAGRKPEERGV